MSNDNTPESAPGAVDFNEQNWQVLIGIRHASDPAHPSKLENGLFFGMAATAEVMVNTPQGPRPDKTNEAVHFAQWLDRNKEALVSMWRTEYAQYMNLRRLSERGVPGLRIVGADEQPGLVAADGSKLQ